MVLQVSTRNGEIREKNSYRIYIMSTQVYRLLCTLLEDNIGIVAVFISRPFYA